MSEYVVKLPDVGEGVAEAEIVDWHVAVGDSIAENDVMVEVMTDKATVELPSPVSGVVVSLGGNVGDVLSVGAALIRIETEDIASDPATPSAGTTEPGSPTEPPEGDVAGSAGLIEPAVNPAPAVTAATAATAATSARRGSVLAAPAVRQRASTLGIDLTSIAGTGPDGRVIHADLDSVLRGNGRQATANGHVTQTAANDAVEAVPVVGLRRNIAQRMQVAKDRIPHFSYVEEIDVTEVERLRAQLNEQYADARGRLTVLPFVMLAVVEALRDHPQLNARYDEDNGVVNRHAAVHLGIATQTSKGLMVAVVKHAESHDLWAAASEVARLSAAARDGTITLEELNGSTLTITSLGALGGIVSTPIINYPEVAIVGVNKIATRPVYVDGAVVPRQIMNLSSSFDHRIIDGADAAAFIQRVKVLLESPALLFVN
jgi:2-oxoisovalerate dehydrogenase E2 component (dihydrolipoyl transacylase)